MNSLLDPIEIVRPEAIEFGPGTVAAVARFVEAKGLRRTLVVADAFNAARVDLLGLPGEVTIFGEVKPEPDIPSLEAALAAAEAEQAGPRGRLRRRQRHGLGQAGGRPARERADDPGRRRSGEGATATGCAIQVPTTSGTGSEAGTRALVTDPATQNKLAVQSRHMLADLAVVDPDLTMTVPPQVTAATGVDALAHCVEAYTSRKAHPLIDLYALEGIRLVGRYLPRAVRDGNDREARAGLSLASLYGGFCLGPVNTTAGHAVAYPLGTRHHIPHGLACALIFPHTLAFNASAVPERTAAVLDALGLAGSRRRAGIVARTSRWCSDLGIEMRLARLGVPERDLPIMADEAHTIRRLLDNNPRDISRNEILALYRAAY